MSTDVWASAENARIAHQQRQAEKNKHVAPFDPTQLANWNEKEFVRHEREVTQKAPRHRLDVDPATLIADAVARYGER